MNTLMEEGISMGSWNLTFYCSAKQERKGRSSEINFYSFQQMFFFAKFNLLEAQCIFKCLKYLNE